MRVRIKNRNRPVICKTLFFRFKELLQVNLLKIPEISLDISLEELLARYYRFSNANNNDTILLKALEVRSTQYASYHMLHMLGKQASYEDVYIIL